MASVIARAEGGLLVIEFDAVTNEGHSLNATVTDHPVEEGSAITDHIRPEPDVLQMECIISNTPFSTAQQERAIRQGATTIKSTSPGELPDRARISYETFRFMRDTGALLTVVTGLRTYRNMVLMSLSAPRDSKKTNALFFSATFKAIIVVANKLTTRKPSKDKRVPKKIPVGTQTPKPVEEDRRSRLIRIGNVLGKASDSIFGSSEDKLNQSRLE